MNIEELEVVGECGEWDYDWHIGKVLRDKDGGLWWGSDGGCSCNDWGYDWRTTDDLTRVASLAEAVELAKADGFSDSEVAEFAEQLLF
jgi:hypothetical protein